MAQAHMPGLEGPRPPLPQNLPCWILASFPAPSLALEDLCPHCFKSRGIKAPDPYSPLNDKPTWLPNMVVSQSTFCKRYQALGAQVCLWYAAFWVSQCTICIINDPRSPAMKKKNKPYLLFAQHVTYVLDHEHYFSTDTQLPHNSLWKMPPWSYLVTP